jgi:hypothetical protein
VSDLLEHIAKALEADAIASRHATVLATDMLMASAARTLLPEAARELEETRAQLTDDQGELWESECMRARAERDKLRAELKIAREALEWYVDRYGVDGPQSDISAKARDALAALTSRDTETTKGTDK